MADAFELEEMVVRFTADNMQYVQKVKDVQKVTQEAVQVAKRAADDYAKLPVAKRVAETVQQVKVSQDAAGRWRNERGQFATAQELRAAAQAARETSNASSATREYAAQLDRAAAALDRKTAKQHADTGAVREATNQQSALSKLMQKSSDFLAPVAAGLSVGGITSAVMKGIGLASEAESIDITFETIVGDAEKAKTVLTDLRAFADWSPFNTGEVMEASKLMLAMNTPADQLVSTMTMLGDVSGSLNIPIKDLSYVFGTLRSQGRAFTADINQFATRGIPIWSELAKIMYDDEKAIDKVRAATESGQVSFDLVNQAFQRMTGAGGKFFGGMEKQATSLGGLWATLQSEMDNGLKNLGKEVIEAFNLKWVVGQVTALTKQFSSLFAMLSPETKRFIAFTVLAVAGIMGIVGAVALLGTVFNTMFGGMGIVIGVLVTAAAATAAWAASTGSLEEVWREVSYNAKQFYEWVKPLIPLIVTLVSVGNPLLGLIILLVTHWKQVVKAVQDFGRWASPILRDLKYTVIALATAVRDGLVAAFNWVIERLKPIVERIKAMWTSVFGETNWTSVQAGIQDLIVFVEYAFSHMGQVADLGWKAIKYGALVALNWIVKNVFVVLAVVLFPALLAGMVLNWKEMLQGMAVAVVIWGHNLIEFFKGVFKSLVDGIAKAIGPETLMRIIKGELKPEDLLKDAFQDVTAGIGKKFADTMRLMKGVKLTLTGVEIPALDNAVDQAKKELDDAIGKVQLDFGEFKKQRNAKIFVDSLKQIGLEAWKAIGQPSKAAGEIGKEAGTDLAKGMADGLKGGMKEFNAVLKDSLEEAVRSEQYLEYIRGLSGKGFNPQLPPGAVPVGQWKPPVQAGPPGQGVNERGQELAVLGAIAAILGRIENKPPIMSGPAGL